MQDIGDHKLYYIYIIIIISYEMNNNLMTL